jgi:hypothetical protein
MLKHNLRCCVAVAVAAALFSARGVTALDLVRQGRPVATIVLSGEALPSEQSAAAALARYVKIATGAALQTVTDRDVPPGTLISVGRTKLAARAGITAEGLQGDGYRIAVRPGFSAMVAGGAAAAVAEPGVLFLLGRDQARTARAFPGCGANGTWRGTLQLLERLGFRWLQPTAKGFFAPELQNLSVPDDLAVTVNPQFLTAIGRMVGLGDWSVVHGFHSAVNLYSQGGHTWCTFVPATYWETHPEYFRMSGGKRIKPEGDNYFLCPSNPAVQALLAEGIRKKFDEGYDWVQLGQSDGYRPCECPACKALDKPGECHEQVQIPHYNVIRMLQATHPHQTVHLLLYGPTTRPSASIDRYPANVIGELAMTGAMAEAFLAPRIVTNRDLLDLGHEAGLRAWSQRIPAGLTVYVYYFGTYHAAGLAPKCSPRRMAEEIRRLCRFHVRGIYFCGGGENWGGEGPAYYTVARLMNDPSLDWQVLLDEYCHLSFGLAADTMRQYYELLYRQLDNGPFDFPDGMTLMLALYPLPVLHEMDALLAKARAEALGNDRAGGWLRLVELSHRHLAGIARAYHAYRRSLERPSRDEFERVENLVLDYRGLAADVQNMNLVDPDFVRDYFPSWQVWEREVAGNGGVGPQKLGPPFTWDFQLLKKENWLPGNVYNGGFEAASADGKLPAGWNAFPAAADACRLDDAVARSGRRSLHVAPLAGRDDPMVEQRVPRCFKAGQKLRFSCYVKTRDLKGWVLLVAQAPAPSADTQPHYFSARLSGSHDWTRLSVAFPVRAGFGEARFEIRVGGTAGEAWFDDAALEEVPEQAADKKTP